MFQAVIHFFALAPGYFDGSIGRLLDGQVTPLLVLPPDIRPAAGY
jgi:hypothetical protein